MLNGLSVIAEQWFVSLVMLSVFVFLLRKDKDNAFTSLAILIPLAIGLVARDYLWNNPMLWNFGYGMLSIFTLWALITIAIRRRTFNKRIAMLALFLFLGVIINYARHLDRMNGTRYVSPVYFVWINASNLGVITWLYLPLVKDLIRMIKRKIYGYFNPSHI